VYAVKVESKNILQSAKATYAQAADWGVAEAEGFIKLYGMSSTLWAEVDRANGN
jgi:argininosuccinate synthase